MCSGTLCANRMLARYDHFCRVASDRCPPPSTGPSCSMQSSDESTQRLSAWVSMVRVRGIAH